MEGFGFVGGFQMTRLESGLENEAKKYTWATRNSKSLIIILSQMHTMDYSNLSIQMHPKRFLVLITKFKAVLSLYCETTFFDECICFHVS